MDDALQQEIATLRADLKKISGDLLSLTSRIGNVTMTGASDGLDDLKDTGEQMQARLRQVADEAGATLEQQIHARPLGMFLLAFGVGLLLGKSFGRG